MNESIDLDDKQTDSIESHAQQEAAYTRTLHKKYLGIRKRYWVIGLLVIAIALTIVLVVYKDTLAKPETFSSLGPLGLFLFCLASNATVIFPVGAVFAVILAPQTFGITPLEASLIGASAACIGELSGYMAGYGSQAAIKKRGFYLKIEHWMERRGFITIIFFSVFALAFDAAGLAAGAFRYPVWRFIIACWIGRAILYITMSYLAAWGFDVIENKVLVFVLIGVIALVIVIFIIIKQLRDKKREKAENGNNN
ncbi:MAG: hypothetical protein HN929_06790 [Chloroflexi bacterium]|jgi:uncharacterized membrane protein YdjX (TVP38/TMEM64 family)|nr:hypothetical protein [Chloroflexota bacterium]